MLPLSLLGKINWGRTMSKDLEIVDVTAIAIKQNKLGTHNAKRFHHFFHGSLISLLFPSVL